MSKIVFENPPPSAARRGTPRTRALTALAAGLRIAPGEWARVGTYRNASTARTTASLIRRGELAAFTPAGAFEAEYRDVGGKARVYARATGGATAEQPATDTLPEWLNHRYGRSPHGWDALSDDDRSYWAHEAAAVRRAVARGGFKAPAGGEQT